MQNFLQNQMKVDLITNTRTYSDFKFNMIPRNLCLDCETKLSY